MRKVRSSWRQQGYAYDKKHNFGKEIFGTDEGKLQRGCNRQVDDFEVNPDISLVKFGIILWVDKGDQFQGGTYG